MIKVVGAVDFAVVLGLEVVAVVELAEPHAASANEKVAAKRVVITAREALRAGGRCRGCMRKLLLKKSDARYGCFI